jgi:hypothetical protein
MGSRLLLRNVAETDPGKGGRSLGLKWSWNKVCTGNYSSSVHIGYV